MFDSETMSREELIENYEQASAIIGSAKLLLSEELFRAILITAAFAYTQFKKEEEGIKGNLPPGWEVYSGKG